MAHSKLAGTDTNYATNPLWMSGMAMVIVGSVCDLVSFGFAPMSLLAPLGAMTLVINMFIAPCFLNESLSKRDVVFTLIIVVGTVVCVCFGSKDEQSMSIDYLLDLYSHTPFIIFAVVTIFVLLAMYFLLKQSAQREEKMLHTAWDMKFQAFAYPVQEF
jgi:drug/metabolite transporter (DMT)-like permease